MLPLYLVNIGFQKFYRPTAMAVIKKTTQILIFVTTQSKVGKIYLFLN